MKDKTHAMNMGISAEEADCGYQVLPNDTVPQRRQYKYRQQDVAGLADNEALIKAENPYGDEETSNHGGFLPRSNYSDRF